VCIDDPCAEMTCSDGQICCPAAIDCQTAGACIPDPCTRVECPYGKLCHPLTGQCIDDPCRDIRCPHPEERCELGQCLPPPPEPDEHPKSESIDPEQTPESGSSESLNESTHTETPPIPDAQNQEISSEYKSSEHTENTEHITGSDQTGNQPDHISEGCGCASTSNIPYSLLFALILLCLTLPRKNLSRSQ
jgi:hypothetical protein